MSVQVNYLGHRLRSRPPSSREISGPRADLATRRLTKRLTHLVPFSPSPSRIKMQPPPDLPLPPTIHNVCHPAPIHAIPIHTHPRTRPQRLVPAATPAAPPCLHPATALPHDQDATARPPFSPPPRLLLLCPPLPQAHAPLRAPPRVLVSLIRDTRDAARSPHLHLLVCLLPSAPHHTTAPAHLDRTHTPHTPAVGHVPCTARPSGGAFTSRPRAAGQVTVTRQCMASRSGGRGGEGQEAIRRAGDEVQAQSDTDSPARGAQASFQVRGDRRKEGTNTRNRRRKKKSTEEYGRWGCMGRCRLISVMSIWPCCFYI